MLSPIIQRVGLKPLPFENAFFRPKLVETDGIDPYLAGAATQCMQRIDTRAIDSIRRFLFKDLPMPPMDLAALNIQRGRDHGLPDYNRCRVAYGLRPKEDFRDISSDAETQQRLRQAYDGDIRLIDPWIGGLAEDHHGEAAVGELFFHVLKDQFERTRDGDRFWYENDPAFTDTELDDIRSTSLERVITRNTNIKGLQKNVFRVKKKGPQPKISPRKRSAHRRTSAEKSQPRSKVKRKTKRRK